MSDYFSAQKSVNQDLQTRIRQTWTLHLFCCSLVILHETLNYLSCLMSRFWWCPLSLVFKTLLSRLLRRRRCWNKRYVTTLLYYYYYHIIINPSMLSDVWFLPCRLLSQWKVSVSLESVNATLCSDCFWFIVFHRATLTAPSAGSLLTGCKWCASVMKTFLTCRCRLSSSRLPFCRWTRRKPCTEREKRRVSRLSVLRQTESHLTEKWGEYESWRIEAWRLALLRLNLCKRSRS